MTRREVKYALAAALLASTSLGAMSAGASAADLGGNCCADLEERIAELEATTARKGNRKVSLAVSGWVAQQIVFWDDGVEQNAYIGGVGTTLASNVTFSGQAQIAPGWNAGYVLQIEVNPNDPFFQSQSVPNGTFEPGLPSFGTGVHLLQSYWFIKSDKLGKVSIGQISPASDNGAILPQDGSGTLFPANWVLFDPIRAFQLRRNGAPIVNGASGATLTWGDIANCAQVAQAGGGIGSDCTAAPGNFVRYDSPVFAGFSASASWGEDDFWDVALRYAGEFSGIKVSIGGAYSENKDENWIVPTPATRDVQYFQIGGYAEHVSSGLWAYAAYGHENIDSVQRVLGSDDHWYVKAGVKLSLFSIGQTIPYAEYGEHKDMLAITVPDATGSEIHRWGIGFVQNIDAAAMSMWVAYRNIDGSIDGGTSAGDLDNYQFIKAGAVINF